MRNGAKRSNASAMGIYGLLVLAVALLSLFMLLQKPTEAALPPTTMNFQGRLADSSGNLMPDGLYNMQFRLFSVSSGGSAVWTETRETTNRVQVTNGLFSTQLGEATPLSASLFNATDLYFEITMATPATANCATASCATWETPMTPRQKLATSAYAFNSATLNGKADTDFGQLAVSNTWTGTNAVRVTSATAFRVQNAGGTTLLAVDTSGNRVDVTGDLDVSGRGAYGNNGTLGDSDAGTTSVLSVEQNITSVTNNIDDIAINGELTVNPNINPANDTSFIGLQGSVVVDPANSTSTTRNFFFGGRMLAVGQGSGNIQSLIGSEGGALNTSTGTVSDMTGAAATAINLGGPVTSIYGSTIIASNGAPASVDTLYGQYMALSNNTGGTINTLKGLEITTTNLGTVNDAAGIVIDEVVGNDATNLLLGTTTIPNGSDYSIYSASTRESYFAGAITVNDDLTVNGGNTLRLVGDTSTNIQAIGSPTEGMITYDTTNKQLLTYTNGKWQADRSDAILVAASNSSQADKNAADYVADGEIGDGQTTLDGDQVEINQALTVGAGKKVVLLAGTYVADATVFIPNNTTLAGVGNDTVIELADIDVADNLIEASGTNRTGQVIRDLKLDGRNDLNTVGYHDGVHFSGVGSDTPTYRAGGRVESVTAVNFTNSAIFVDGSNNLVTNSYVEDAEWGVFVNWNGGNNQVRNNTVIAIRSEGVALYNGGYDNVVDGNSIIDSVVEGIRVYQSTNSVITNNVITNSGNIGILVDSGADETIIANNAVSDSASWGIGINSSKQMMVANNVVSNSGGTAENDGIYTYSADDSQIVNNTITDTQCDTTCYAINIANSGAVNNYLSSNIFSDTDPDDDATINDVGTGTIFANQSMTAGGLDALFKQADSSSAFDIQNAAGSSLFTADTANMQLLVGGDLLPTTTSSFDLGATASRWEDLYLNNSIVLGSDTDNAAIAYDGTNDVVTISNPLHVSSVTFNDATTAADGTNAEYTANYFGAPTISATNSNVTTDIATTFKIQGAPAAGANQSFNEAYALWVDSDDCPPQFCQVQYVDHQTLSITETDQAVTPVSMVIAEADQTPTVVDQIPDTSLLYETDDMFALGRVSGSVVQLDNDGNIVLLGNEYNVSGLGSGAMTLTKVDANNEVVWQKAFGDTGYDWSRDVAIDSNNDYIVVGDTTSYGAGSYDAVISKFDSDGVEQWTKTWGGTGYDGFIGVMVDSNGDYIAVGYYDDWGASAGSVIVKFNSSGVEQWSQRWGGSGSGIDVVEDGSGNYIVSSQSSSFGSGDQDAVLTKFNSSGVEQWTKTWGGSKDEYTNQLVVDSSGDIVVQVDTDSYGLVGGGTTLSKFNSSGVEQWTVAIDGSGYDGMYGLIENSLGNYVATGETGSYGNGDWDALIVEYDTDGNVVWAKTWGGENYDGAYSITETASGVYAIAGKSENFGMNNESFIAEVTGTPQSISRFDGVVEVNGISRVNGDSEVSGSLKVGGGTHNSAAVSVRGDRRVNWWGANGIELSVGGSKYTDVASLSSEVVAFNTIKQSTLQSSAAATTENAATLLLQGSPVAGSNQTITSSYALWVAGGGCSVGICTELELTETDRTITETNQAYTEVDRTLTETDQAVTEVDFTADSDVIYESIINRAVRFDTRNSETLDDVLVDSNGDYVYAGSTYKDGSYQSYLVKFNWNDGVIWAKHWGGDGDERVRSVAQDGSGNYIVAGYAESFGAGDRDVMVTKLNSSGVEQWTKTWGGVDQDEARSVIVDSSGDIVITGHTSSYSAGAQDLFLLKLDSNGIEQWSKTLGGLYSDEGNALIEDAAGDYVVAGFYNSDALITKFNSSGIVQWSKTLDGSSNKAYGIIQDSSNDYVIAGRNGGWGEAYISKLNSSGVEQWTKSIDYEATSVNDELFDIAVDSADNYIVAGNHYSFTQQGDLSYITQFDSDGIEQWSRYFSGPGTDDMIKAVDVDGNGDYVIGGYSYNFDYGIIIARMSASGATSFDGDGDARFDGKIHANNQIAIKTNSSTALNVQNASGSNVLTVDTTLGRVQIGSSTTDASANLFGFDSYNNAVDPSGFNGAMYYNTNINKFRCYENGEWKDCISGADSERITLVPEFQGAVIQGDGSNNNGTMYSGFVDGLGASDGYKHNYYEWYTSQSTAQDYDIVLNHQLPSDFNATNEFDAGSWKVWTYSDNLTNGSATMTIYDADGTACASAVSIEGASTGWEQVTLTDFDGVASCDFTANSIITIKVTLGSTSPSTNKVRLGEIQYDYSR